MATAADGDGDGSVFEMGFNKWNDAANRGGERDNLSLKNRVAKETTKVLKIVVVGRSPRTPAGPRRMLRHPVEAKETLQESPGSRKKYYMRERETWFYCIWEVGYVSLFRDSRMSYTDI